MASRIEDYALVGDCETAAVIAKDGSIDWLCWPRFDSGPCFAALLGDVNNGRWRIAPAAAAAPDANGRVRRRYLRDTLILETASQAVKHVVTTRRSRGGPMRSVLRSSGGSRCSLVPRGTQAY